MIVESMCTAVESILNKIHLHPFNIELGQGTLSESKFVFYLQQDALYLTDYSRALALTAARLPQNEHAELFMQFALNAIKTERELHSSYLSKYQSEAQDLEQSPACFMYTNYLLKMASMASIEEAAASLLPCFWIYHMVGKHLSSLQTEANNPYYAWIDMYSSGEFADSVQNAIAIVNDLGRFGSDRTRQSMMRAFVHSSQLEWMFWEDAYYLRRWVV